jgi:steroid delta-isomerase-like uncharacterized protein
VEERLMTLDENKAVVRRFVEEIFVAGRHETVDELLSDDFVAHTWPSMSGDPKADLKAAIDRAAAGLSNAEFTIDDLIAEGDRVAARLTTGATHTGTFMGMPPTGKRYSIEEIHWFRLRDGKVVEHWHQFDQMGMMKQLGAMPGGPADGAGAGGRDSADGEAPQKPEPATANR